MAAVTLGRIGIWTTALDFQPAAQAQQAAAQLEALGYGAIWIGESVRREVFANAAILLSGTRRIVIASGIANIYARDPWTMAAGQKTLAEAFPDRFLLGLGVSHAASVESRGHDYRKPIETMRAYLDAMDKAPFQAAPPKDEPRRVLAALGPRMLALARDRSWAPTHTSSPLSTPGGLARFSAGIDCSPQSRPSCSKRIQTGHGASPAGTPRATSRCRTTPTTCGGSGIRRVTWRRPAATGWSMTWLPGETRAPSRGGWTSIAGRERITSASRS